MKILFTVLFCATINLTAFSQDAHTAATQKTGVFTTAAYRLFPTHNMWTFIKLNTRNGQLSQIQYDNNLTSGKRSETTLPIAPLVSEEKEANDRFTLYTTQNIYTFLLLDQIDGRAWQVQWSSKSSDSVIIPIERELIQEDPGQQKKK